MAVSLVVALSSLSQFFPPSEYPIFPPLCYIKHKHLSSWTMYSKKKKKKGKGNSKNPESNVSGRAIILYEVVGKIDCQGSKG